LFLVGVALLAVGAVAQTRHRAVAAADLAALAAAGDAPDGESAACARARWVTDHMRVHLTGCRLSGWDALVEVSATLPGALDRFGDATAHSRAGPADN
jgi:secretion/DNA translocation related TadE-like protein